jgi:hypothetical protein
VDDKKDKERVIRVLVIPLLALLPPSGEVPVPAPVVVLLIKGAVPAHLALRRSMASMRKVDGITTTGCGRSRVSEALSLRVSSVVKSKWSFRVMVSWRIAAKRNKPHFPVK